MDSLFTLNQPTNNQHEYNSPMDALSLLNILVYIIFIVVMNCLANRGLSQPPPPSPPPNLNSPDGYEIGRELGRGAFGVVHFVKQKTDQKILAMKIITVVDSVLQQQEIKILSKINHPNIVMFVRSFVQGHSVYILTELCEHGDLSIKVAEKKQQNKIFNAVLIYVDRRNLLFTQLQYHSSRYKTI